MYINSVSNSSSMNEMYKLLKQVSAGKRINSAADDGAGLAIAKKMEAVETGYNRTNSNIADSQSLLNTADGGLSGTAESLQRIRELAMQAGNGTYSDSDRKIIQGEIDQIKEQIDATSEGSRFNGQAMLNGSQFLLSGTTAQTSFDSSTKALGIDSLDVTKGIDIAKIDKAITAVSTQRGEASAKYSGMTRTMNANAIAEKNTSATRSLIEDVDIAKMVMDFKKSQTVNKAGTFAQRLTQSTLDANAGRFVDMLA